jgi:class 3 adenylate cyclase
VPVDREERRVVTVMFADLSGYTALSERLDPEDVRAVVDHFMDEMGGVVHEHDGFVAATMGDGLMAVFGAPIAHGDDAERAVRTAIDMQARATSQARELGGLPLRVGIDTGEVMYAPVGPEGHKSPSVLGDTVNTAARLQGAARAGGILVGRETYRATQRCFSYVEQPPLNVRGKEEAVRSWEVGRAIREPALRPVSRTPMVGRDSQLRLLLTLWRDVVEQGRPNLITVIGAPGIGKTKLATEFAEEVAATGGEVLTGRSLPYGERSGYEAFAQMIKRWSGIRGSEGNEAARVDLATAVDRLVGIDATDGDSLARYLSVFLGVSGEDTQVDKRTLYGSARRFVELLGGRQPTVLVFEDVHWADESQLDLIEWLAARVQDEPVMFLALTRPELLTDRPGWGGGSAASHTIPLDPLTDAETRALAMRLLPGFTDEATLAQLERSAGGNPLFAEELAAWLSSPDTGGRAVPTTITSMIAARIDTLPLDVRRTLLDASVVGDACTRGVLEQLAGAPAPISDALEELERRGFLHATRPDAARATDELMFKHVLIRDVAYEMLPRATRRDRHRIVATYLEAHGGEGADASLARHWREAGERERAVEHFALAAEQAARGWAKREAVDLYNDALQLLDDDDPRRRAITLKRNVATQAWLHSVIERDQLRARPPAGA